MAAHTTRIRCAVLVVGNTYRNPAILANIATTIDHVSGGRLELGIGAGWVEIDSSGRAGLNCRPPGPKTGALPSPYVPDCITMIEVRSAVYQDGSQ